MQEIKNKVIQGDCLEKLKELETNSVDSIVTDPPYELGFMGKSWDNTGIANNPLMWAECLRVLKPGGHLLAFSGTRTYHRMASAIEDAGFEVRDMIEWVYGCLSFDTEVLTERGFRHLHKLTQYDRIVVYDIEKNIYKWERPQRWNIYQVHEDTAYRIKSDYTDQIVSRNHRCLVEREGKLVFIQAEELNNLEYMPTLQSDFFTLQKRYWKLLFSDLLWKGKELAKGYWTPWEKRLDRKKYGELSNKNDWREKSSVERWSNLFQKTRKLQTNKVCAMSEAIFADGTKRRLCDGTSFDFSKLNQSLPIENGSGASHQSQSAGQPIRKSDVIQIKQGTQITRRARVEKIKYSGIIFCPTVSTGAFVARRNGQVFITGNSGFPKSLNIGKAVDKLQGNEREVVAEKETKDFSHHKGSMMGKETTLDNKTQTTTIIETKGTSEWEGWGTALKPAHEPICMARKPLAEKTVAENVLKYGTGGINIDGSRVGTEIITQRLATVEGGTSIGAKAVGIKQKATGETTTTIGRFPANLIHDNSEEVRECFPEQKSGAVKQFTNNGANQPINLGGGMLKPTEGSSGNASRFFKSIIYQAKASKSERNKGCEGLEEKAKVFNGKSDKPSADMKDVEKRFTTLPKANNHPTVKPIALMEYLIKMVTPKGGVVLDPFAGSGTTGVACINTGRNYILIEKEQEYIDIINKRLS